MWTKEIDATILRLKDGILLCLNAIIIAIATEGCGRNCMPFRERELTADNSPFTVGNGRVQFFTSKGLVALLYRRMR